MIMIQIQVVRWKREKKCTHDHNDSDGDDSDGAARGAVDANQNGVGDERQQRGQVEQHTDDNTTQETCSNRMCSRNGHDSKFFDGIQTSSMAQTLALRPERSVWDGQQQLEHNSQAKILQQTKFKVKSK
jgi:hypothetical protein